MDYSMKKLNYKRYLPLVSALAMVAPTVGNTAGSLYKSGVYTGASVGYTYMNTKVNDNMHAPLVLIDSKQGKGSDHAINGGMFIGYRQFFANGLLWGLEVELVRDNASISKTIKLGRLETKSTLRSSYKFAPTLIIGKQFQERWLGFVKVGMSCAHFKGKHSVIVPTEPESIEKFTANKKGLIVGFGAEYAHNAHLSTIGAVSYERFYNIKKQYEKIFDLNGEKNTGSFKPSYVTAKIGLAYRF